MKGITKQTQDKIDRYEKMISAPYFTKENKIGVRNAKSMNDHVKQFDSYVESDTLNQNIINVFSKDAHDLRKEIERDLRS